jgi:hypothetical protein
MAITAAGLFGLTLEKFLNVTSLPASGLESETATKMALITDAATPAFDTMDFWNDLEANEVSGTGYTAGGNVLTSTEITLSGGVLTYDSADPSWTTSTITNAMGGVAYFDRGGATTADELILLLDFVTAASSSGGTFTVQINASGLATIDYTP